jgi:hypothetical protein
VTAPASSSSNSSTSAPPCGAWGHAADLGYLGIGLGSWVGAALVDVGIESLLR